MAQIVYRYEHRNIFAAIGALIGASKPADVITVFRTPADDGQGRRVWRLAYLNALAQADLPSAANQMACNVVFLEMITSEVIIPAIWSGNSFKRRWVIRFAWGLS